MRFSLFDHLGRAGLEQAAQAIVAIDDAAVQIVQVPSLT